MRSLILTASFAVIAALPVRAQQGPIQIIFDLHVDPLPMQVPLEILEPAYDTRNANMFWALDVAEQYGAKISFLSGGQWMELAVEGGPLGEGAQIIRRMYESGGMVGTHSHDEYRLAPYSWEKMGQNDDLSLSHQVWQEGREFVDLGIMTAFAGSPPEPLSLINNVRGSHTPKEEADFHAFMTEYGYGVREPGPEEDYYGWYGHHIWHPFRPSTENYMAEDLSAPFIQVTQGSVIGTYESHHNILQDMRTGAVKRQFLQLYVNWRWADRTGADEKVWCWGWGSHAHDYDVGSPNALALTEVLPWLTTNFAGRIEPTGSTAMEYASQRDVAEAYLAWEAANPGVSSFSFDSLEVDWDEYPWLRPVAEEMGDLAWTEDLSLPSGVTGFRLSDGEKDHLLLYRDVEGAVIDLSGEFTGEVRVLSLESGAEELHPSDSVPVTTEAVLVEQAPSECESPTIYCTANANSSGAAASISWGGSPSHTSNDFVLLVSGAPANKPGIFYMGDAQASAPFGPGVRCVSGTIRRLPPVFSSSAGEAGYSVDLSHPVLTELCAAGLTQNFQFWFRDPTAGDPGYNLSDGMSVLFCP